MKIRIITFVITGLLLSCGGSNSQNETQTVVESFEPVTPVMLDIKVHTLDTIAMNAQECWAIISDFNALDTWLAPAVIASTMEGQGIGALRTLTLEDGNKIVEELMELDPEQMSMRYRIIEGNPNLNDYVGAKKVIPINENSAAIDWTSTFKTPQGQDSASYAVIKGVHLLLFQNLDQAALNE